MGGQVRERRAACGRRRGRARQDDRSPPSRVPSGALRPSLARGPARDGRAGRRRHREPHMNMLRRLAVTFALAFLSLAGTANAVSQVPAGSWGTNGDVDAVAQSGSKVYLGGGCTASGPVKGPGTAFPLGSDQHVSLPRVSGGGHLVFAVVADGNGGWYVGGAFTRVGGVARSNLAHVLA